MSREYSGRTLTYDPEAEKYRIKHNYARQSDISTTLSVALEEVAEAEGFVLSQLLYESVDPDGLALLFEPSSGTRRNSGKVTFSVASLDVVVQASGEIIITPPERIP